MLQNAPQTIKHAQFNMYNETKLSFPQLRKQSIVTIAIFPMQI